jgi:chromate reductase
MITVISGTNRAGNFSIKMARFYVEILKNKGIESQVLDLQDLPKDFIFSESYGDRTESYEQLLTKFIYSPKKWLLVSAEYNGSYPGVLKSFIDTWDPRKIGGKKMAMVGLSAGRAGNLRGMDHLTNCMNYMKVEVMPNKLPLSQVFNLFKEEVLTDEETILLCQQQVDELIAY